MKKIGIIIAAGILFYLLAAFISGTFNVVSMNREAKSVLTACFLIFLAIYGIIETKPHK